jgi:hypothetical protein
MAARYLMCLEYVRAGVCSNASVPAQQAWGPEFKPLYWQKKKKEYVEKINLFPADSRV